MGIGNAPRVVVVGSCNQDVVIRGGRLPAPGETVRATAVEVGVGGKGLNQAVAAARAGASVTMIGAVGRDAAGEAILAALEQSGVATDLLRRVERPSGVAVITVDESGENTISLAAGANDEVRVLSAEERRAVRSSTVLLLQLEIPLETVVEAARLAHEAGSVVVLTPAPVAEVPADLWSVVDVVLANEGEADAIVGREPGAAAASRLTELVPRAVVTAGRHGSTWAEWGGASGHVPALEVSAVDTTAAGDTFAGYLAEAVGRGEPLPRAIEWATAAGALAVTRRGAAGSIPGRAEVADLLTSGARR